MLDYTLLFEGTNWLMGQTAVTPFHVLDNNNNRFMVNYYYYYYKKQPCEMPSGLK